MVYFLLLCYKRNKTDYFKQNNNKKESLKCWPLRQELNCVENK
jgi:hypothetical protein